MKVGRVNAALELADNMLSLPRHPQYNTGNKGSGRYGRQRSLGALTSYRMWDELLQRADRMFWDAAAVPERQWEHWQHTGIAAAFLQQEADLRLSVNSLQAALDERLQRQAAEKEAAEKEAAEKEAAAKEAAEKEAAEKEAAPKEGSGPPSTENENAEIKAQDKETTAPPKPADPASNSPRPAEREKARKELQQEIDKLQKALASIQAVQAGVDGRYEEALQLADKASGLDDLIKAEWRAAAGRWRESWEAVNSEVTKRPNDVVPLAVKIFLAHQWLEREPTVKSEETPATNEEETPAADEVLPVTLESLRADFESLRRLAGHGDLEAPLLARLASVATQLELAADWRLPNAQAADVGERPELETLGPAHWTPVPAPPLSVVNAAGQETRPLESTGNAKLVMFYLGFGCLHCMEQLQKFSPQGDRFAAQGIELLAVSSESLELLQQGLQNYDKPLSFPLYADRELTSFRAFRAHDDFEQQPLHGTFLLGPDGRVLWHDIGHEPFMDVDFLLNEAPRLLQVWTP